jgi:hypothetical protein
MQGVAAFDAVPLETLEEELRHRGIAVVRIEYVDVLGPKPGAVRLRAQSVREVQVLPRYAYSGL